MEPHKSHYLKHEYDLLISLQDIGKLRSKPICSWP